MLGAMRTDDLLYGFMLFDRAVGEMMADPACPRVVMLHLIRRRLELDQILSDRGVTDLP